MYDLLNLKYKTYKIKLHKKQSKNSIHNHPSNY